MRFYPIFCIAVAVASWNSGWLSSNSQGQGPSTPQFPQLEFRKWSGEINVPDPVAVSVDNQGRVFATQTRRRKVQDLDIRANRDWIPDDVGLQSVEEKRAFFKRVLAIGGDDGEQASRVADLNQDGVHDWRDLTVISEVIYRLVDSDNDGTADQLTVFADNFKTEVTGIAAGVLAYDNAVYATVAPDLWKLRDHNGDGIADSQESIAHGFGLHIAYGGHDMHGPTIGPDGKIYWSIGDKGINVTTADGRIFAYPNEGGVMRCNPDGSDFEVFAHGLRNVQEVAFDQWGNMFGVDNDSDQDREKERFVYIVNGMDAGWRCNYQYRGKAYNPWTAERLWELAGEQHAAYIVPPIQHTIDGPAGFKFNPGTALSVEYKDFFFLTGAPNGNQHAFRIEQDGDSFKMVDEHKIGSGLAIVGLSFGPDGGLYGADWDGGYPLDEIGSIVRIDVPHASQSPERKQVAKLLAEGFRERNKTELLTLLSHKDQRVRQGAQFRLVELNAGDMLASVALNTNADTFSRLHALWGLGQLQRDPSKSSGATLARDVIGMLLKTDSPQLRAQAAKTYGELQNVDGFALVSLLNDRDLQVRTLAGIALSRLPTPQAVEPLLKQADALEASQHYLRHGIVSALSQCATPAQLAVHVKHENELRRMCCVLALRRMGSSRIDEFIHDASDWVATEVARGVHDDLSIAAALPTLACALTERDRQSVAFTVRAINANFRIGGSEASQRVMNFALSERPDVGMRRVAIEALAEWLTPAALDRVEGRRRDLGLSDRNVNLPALTSGLATLADSDHDSLRSAALRAARALEIELPSQILNDMAASDKNDADTRIEAMNSLAASSKTSVPNDLLLTLDAALKSKSADVQARALELICEHFPTQALTRLTRVIERPHFTAVKQAAIAALARLPNSAGAKLLERLVTQVSEGTLDSSLALDVRDAAKLLGDPVSLEKLSSDKFAYSRDGGTASIGKELFNNHVGAQCSRCHKVDAEGSEIGPELGRIAKTRDADYLLRAIAQPSADIDAKYRSSMFLLASGQVLKGIVQSKNASETVIADSAGRLVTVETGEIDDVSEQTVSLMPDMHEILTAKEARDLVAYLRTLK